MTPKKSMVEQILKFSVTGLKPNTLHNIVVGNTDVTSITTTIYGGNTIATDSSGKLEVQVPIALNPTTLNSNVAPSDYVKSQTLLLGTQNNLLITIRNSDGTSTATTILKNPEYSANTPTFDMINTTSLLANLNITVGGSAVAPIPTPTGSIVS